MPDPTPVTALLNRARQGDAVALNDLFPLVYDELHRLARSALKNDRAGHTLQPTALLNEAFLKLFGSELPPLSDRAHFLGIAARVMRQVLVDYARARRAQKRGGGLQVQFAEGIAAAQTPGDLLELDQALERLVQEDPMLVKLIEMRYFAGMTAEETAEVLSESVHVVRHHLRYAQARLRRMLEGAAN